MHTTSEIDYQLSVMAWCVSNPDEFGLLLDRLADFPFADPRAAQVWPILVENFKAQWRWPTEVEALRLVETTLKDAGDLGWDISVEYTQLVYQTDTSEVTGDEVREWVAGEEMKALSFELQTLYSQGIKGKEDDLYEIEDRIKKLQFFFGQRRAGKSWRPLDEDFIERCDERIEEDYGGRVRPTGFLRLDQKLRDGGMRAHNVILHGPTGVGKTALGMAMAEATVRDGGRVVWITFDDNAGELTERWYSRLLKRPFTIAGEKARGSEEFTKVKDQIRQLKREVYIGDFHGEAYDPVTYSPQDIVRELTKIQKMFWAQDRAVASDPLREFDIPETEWGCIDLVVIDTADQLKPEGRAHDDWRSDERTHQALGIIPKRFGCPNILIVQSSQGAEGASQLTNRNVGGAYGKGRPAKLILGFAQTFDQYHSERVINVNDRLVQANLHNMGAFDPVADKTTKWRSFWLCISKNTRGRDTFGAANRVKLPMLVNYASCRVVEDYTRAEELMIADAKTTREEKEAREGSIAGRREAGKRAAR